jgi:hypothetical protein
MSSALTDQLAPATDPMSALAVAPRWASGTKASHRFDNAKRRRPDSHARQAMLTPGYVLEPIRELLGGIGLDPCTEPDNPTGARTFYHLPMDGCALPWNEPTVFCNPPYGEARNRWVERCIAESAHRKVVLLIPSHTETRIFQHALAYCSTVLLVHARLRFGVLRENRRQEAASHGSAIFGFGVDLSPLRNLGTVLSPNQSHL